MGTIIFKETSVPSRAHQCRDGGGCRWQQLSRFFAALVWAPRTAELLVGIQNGQLALPGCKDMLHGHILHPQPMSSTSSLCRTASSSRPPSFDWSRFHLEGRCMVCCEPSERIASCLGGHDQISSLWEAAPVAESSWAAGSHDFARGGSLSQKQGR